MPIPRPRSALLCLLSSLAPLLLACAPTGGGTPPPAAATPVMLSLDPADPAGTAAPVGAPAMFTTRLKFRIPSGTLFEVAENGWLLRESTTNQCNDDGCYAVLSRVDDGAGQTTWVIQVWPQALRRFSNEVKYIITDVSLNSGVTGAQLASRPETTFVLTGVSPTLGGPPLPQTAEWAAVREEATLEFATIGLSSSAEADAYYLAVDPTSDRTTLPDWRERNGFSRTDDSQDDARAYYFNAGDLVLGRAMHMKVQPNGDIAYYVSNYPTVNDAVRGTNKIATVAMEYSPIPPGTARVMKFFVFGGNDARVTAADLDGNGAKFIPNLCIICHGSTKYTAGGSADVGARFLPFDLSSYQYDQVQGRGGQEAAFKQLNLGMLASNRSAATAELIGEWYRDQAAAAPNTARATQNDDAVPAGWAGQEPLYLNVIRPTCRSCHVSRNPDLDFGSFTSFQNLAQRATTAVCGTRTMPNAKVNYQRFWLQHLPAAAGGSMVGAINAAGVTGWTGTPCPQ